MNWYKAAQLGDDTAERIRQKAVTTGINVFRGQRPVGARGYASDPGDFGRGIYYTTSGHRAQAHGGKGSVSQQVIRFSNPIVLAVEAAYDLAEQYGTVQGGDERMDGAQRVTNDMIQKGHDSMIVVFGDRGELEIVDYRPFMGQQESPDELVQESDQ